MEIILAEQPSTNVGRCLPDELGNVLRRRENLERLPKPVDLSNSSEAFTEFRAPSKQATNGSANSYLYVVITQSSSPPSAGIVETAPIVWTTPAIRHRDSTAPIIQIPRETEAEDSTECRKLKNLTFANLLLFVWLLAHAGQTRSPSLAISSHQRPRKPPLAVQTSTMVTIMPISNHQVGGPVLFPNQCQTTSMPLSHSQSCAEPCPAVFGCRFKIRKTPNAAPHAAKRKIVLLRLLFFSLGCLLMADQKLPPRNPK